MKIANIRIRNFRTIKTEINFDVKSGITIVGPNNSGKSNILRSIDVFFSGWDTKYRYEKDFSHGIKSERTSITVTFDPEPNDTIYTDKHEELRNLHPDPPPRSKSMALNAYYTEKNKVVYSFFPNTKRPSGSENAEYSRLQQDLINSILSLFQVIYIPSAKSHAELFSEFISPQIANYIKPILSQILPEVDRSLLNITSIMNATLVDSGMESISTVLATTPDAHASLISSVQWKIADEISTEFSRKGTGVQSAAIFSALAWIDRVRREGGSLPVWLIEEPETYLHPDLTKVVRNLIARIGVTSTTIMTTHSLAFVPTEVEKIIGCTIEGGKTVTSRFDTFNKATDSIRRSLGVKFSDYFGLDVLNVAVEGKSDRSIFEEIIAILVRKHQTTIQSFGMLLNAHFLTFTGVKDLAAFLKVTYGIIIKERVLVSVFDGDDAGIKARNELQGYFGNKGVSFSANSDFVSVRYGFPIEGLFPDDWIKELHAAHPNYFSTFATDAQGVLEPFSIRDEHKSNIQKNLLDKAAEQDGLEWAERFLNVFEAIENALDGQQRRLQESA